MKIEDLVAQSPGPAAVVRKLLERTVPAPPRRYLTEETVEGFGEWRDLFVLGSAGSFILGCVVCGADHFRGGPWGQGDPSWCVDCASAGRSTGADGRVVPMMKKDLDDWQQIWAATGEHADRLRAQTPAWEEGGKTKKEAKMSQEFYLLCEPWAASTEERRLLELALEYHRRTEEYDQVVCSGRRGRVAVPADGRELRMINRHASRVFEDLVLRQEGRREDMGFRVALRRVIARTARDFDRTL